MALALELELREVLVDRDHPLLVVEQQVVRELGRQLLWLLQLRLGRVRVLVRVGRRRVAVLCDVALLARDLAAGLALLVEPASGRDELVQRA